MGYVDPDGRLAWFVVPFIGGAISAAIDFGTQYLKHDGNLKCINKTSVLVSFGLGALTSSTGPGGFLFGRSARGAAARSGGSFPPKAGLFNRGNKRLGWSFNKRTGKQHFSYHGGKPKTPGHFHKDFPFGIPQGDHNVKFAVGGGVLGGITNATKEIMKESCECQ